MGKTATSVLKRLGSRTGRSLEVIPSSSSSPVSEESADLFSDGEIAITS